MEQATKLTSQTLILIGVLIGLVASLVIMAYGYNTIRKQLGVSRVIVEKVMVIPTPTATPSGALKPVVMHSATIPATIAPKK